MRKLPILLLLACLAIASACTSSAGNLKLDGGLSVTHDATGALPLSGLPVPATQASIPKPAGKPGNLKVVDWAGFKSAASYTFDDGQPSHIEHYADLQASGVRMTFFLNSSATWATGFTSTFTQAVKDGHELGNHTAHHCHANGDGTLYNTDASGARTACTQPTAGQDFDECTTFITSTLGQTKIWTAASPFGDGGFSTAAGERFFLNRGVIAGTVAANGTANPFNLPVYPVVENDTLEKLNTTIDNARLAGRWVILMFHSLAPTTNRWYATVDISAVTGSIAHAKDSGDVWLDTMANVGAYWRGQAILAAAVPASTGTSTTWTWTLPAGFPAGKFLRVTVDGGRLSQGNAELTWDPHGYYEVALDAGTLTLSP